MGQENGRNDGWDDGREEKRPLGQHVEDEEGHIEKHENDQKESGLKRKLQRSLRPRH